MNKVNKILKEIGWKKHPRVAPNPINWSPPKKRTKFFWPKQQLRTDLEKELDRNAAKRSRALNKEMQQVVENLKARLISNIDT